jgi:hypothetical protein
MDQLTFGPGGLAWHGDHCRDQLILSIPSVRVKSPSPFGLRRTRAWRGQRLGEACRAESAGLPAVAGAQDQVTGEGG